MSATTPARSARFGSSTSWTSTWSPRRSAFHWNVSITPPDGLRRARPGRTGYRATIPVLGSVLESDHPGTSGGSASIAAQVLRSRVRRGQPGSQKGPAVHRLSTTPPLAATHQILSSARGRPPNAPAGGLSPSYVRLDKTGNTFLVIWSNQDCLSGSPRPHFETHDRHSGQRLGCRPICLSQRAWARTAPRTLGCRR